MSYDRKPTRYPQKRHQPGNRPSPSQPAEPAQPDEFGEKASKILEYARAHPDIGDLEQYPRENFAGAGRRFSAYLLDCLIVIPSMLVVSWILGTLPLSGYREAASVGVFGLEPRVANAITKLVQLLLYDVYFTATVHRWSGTWGQKFVGISVLCRDLALPNKGQARGRYFATVLATLPVGLGLLGIVSGRHRRGWQDKLSGTYTMLRDNVPGDVVWAASRRTRDKKETAKEGADATGALMFVILFVFAPGLIVLGLCYVVLRKTGLIKKKAEVESGEETD